jgi:hypothetical protein
MVCLLYLNENSIAHARYLIRRLRHRMPATSILVAFLSLPADPSGHVSVRNATKAESVSTSLVDILDAISVVWRDGDKPPVSTEKVVARELTTPARR